MNVNLSLQVKVLQVLPNSKIYLLSVSFGDNQIFKTTFQKSYRCFLFLQGYCFIHDPAWF